MSDLINDSKDTYGNSHDWKQFDSHQWGVYGGRARTPWECKRCQAFFIHFYHETPLIRQAMREAEVPDLCPALKLENNINV